MIRLLLAFMCKVYFLKGIFRVYVVLCVLVFEECLVSVVVC